MSRHLLPPAQHDSASGAWENDLQSCDEFDSNSAVLRYLYQVLLEEDEEEDDNGLSQEALAAAERSFYDVLTDKTASSPNSTPVPSNLQNLDQSGEDVNLDSSISNSALQFIKGAEEGLRFLPDISHFFAGSETEAQPEGSRQSMKNVRVEDGEPEIERLPKQSASDVDEETLSLEFDRVLLYERDYDLELKRRPLQKDKRNAGNVELESLLNQCAQAIMENEKREAFDLLAQIRVRSSLTGNGIQRMASYFADALEVRLTGFSMKSLTSSYTTMPRRASELLVVHHLWLSLLPFMSVVTFFTNRRIMKAAENATKLHVVDFGIFYGFKWPLFIQQLASRPGGPPKLRMTGIDLPQPGLRPNRRIEEAGRMLKNYASRFSVPFEFQGVMKKWETVELSDFKMEEDEILAVNAYMVFHQLSDEVVGETTPRDRVLNLIRKMNPAVFVFGTYNSAHGSSFFYVRFREAMYHFGALFDLLDTTLPREMPARKMYEEIASTEITIALAMEGAERTSRPERVHSWEKRINRAGFGLLPIEKQTMERAKAKLASSYHEDFLIHKDRGWIMQGWRGRILSGVSAWK